MQLASRYGRYGYRRVSALLRRDGWRVNHKRVDGSGGWKGSRSRPSSPSGDGSGLPTAPVCASGHNDRTTCGPTTLWLFVPVMADLFVSSRWWMSIPGNVWPSRLGVRYAHPTSLSAWETSWWSTVCRSISVQITALSSLPGLSVHGYREWGFRPSSSHQGARGRTDTWRASMASCGMSSWIGRSSILSGRCRSSRSNGDTNTTMCALTAP